MPLSHLLQDYWGWAGLGPSTHSPISYLAQPFLLVLIDGDGYNFHESALQSGLHGGFQAAQDLQNEVHSFVRARPSLPQHARIMVKMYININSHAGVYSSKKLVRVQHVTDFYRGFFRGLPLCDVVDCGKGKEGADEKIRENLHFFAHRPDCCSIIFAGCHDNGYVRTLEQYVRHPVIQQKITLLETARKGLEYSNLPFEKVAFPAVFTDEELRDRPRLESWYDAPPQNTDTAPPASNAMSCVQQAITTMPPVGARGRFRPRTYASNKVADVSMGSDSARGQTLGSGTIMTACTKSDIRSSPKVQNASPFQQTMSNGGRGHGAATVAGTLQTGPSPKLPTTFVQQATGQSNTAKEKEFDYYFDIDLGSGSLPLTLPYNLSQTPYDAAYDFLKSNKLPMRLLYQTVDHILESTKPDDTPAQQTEPESLSASTGEPPGSGEDLAHMSTLTSTVQPVMEKNPVSLGDSPCPGSSASMMSANTLIADDSSGDMAQTPGVAITINVIGAEAADKMIRDIRASVQGVKDPGPHEDSEQWSEVSGQSRRQYKRGHGPEVNLIDLDTSPESVVKPVHFSQASPNVSVNDPPTTEAHPEPEGWLPWIWKVGVW